MWYLILYNNDTYEIYNTKEDLEKQIKDLAHDGFFEGKHYDIYQIKKIKKIFKKRLTKATKCDII